MADMKLEKSAPFAGCELPITLGSARAEHIDLGVITAILPFKGRAMAVGKVLKENFGAGLPKAGAVVFTDGGEFIWFAPGQWFVIGDFPEKPRLELQGSCGVVDQGDSWTGIDITGNDATTIMARLCPLDFAILSTEQVARSEFSGVGAIILARHDGYRVIIPRSYAKSVIGSIHDTMKSIGAQALISD